MIYAMIKNMKQKIRFGPAGAGLEFYQADYKKQFEIPKWLNSLGLNAYEYQATRGVKINKSTTQALKNSAKRFDIQLSIHAPYFINLASNDLQKKKNSIYYILNSMQAAKWIGSDKVVLHLGWHNKELGEDQVLRNIISALSELLQKAKKQNLDKIKLATETAGKIKQFGNLKEIIAVCKEFPKNIIPAIDFGHLHARMKTKGLKGLVNKKAYQKIFKELDLNKIDIKNLHIHFSIVEHNKGGEFKHHTLKQENKFGPKFKPLAEIIVEKNLKPTIICESRDKMASDALILKSLLFKIKKCML